MNELCITPVQEIKQNTSTMSPLKILVSSLLGIFLPLLSISQTKAECETIFFIEADGVSYKKYVDIRTDNSSPSPRIFNNIKKGKNPKSHYLYVNPKDYEFKEIPHKSYNLMIFNGNHYSFMEKGNLLDDGEMTLTNGQFNFSNYAQEESRGYKGYYWQGGIFTKFSFTWIFPPNFRILKNTCNQKGDWVINGNTLSFYGEEINNLVFDIQYQKEINNELPSFKGRAISVVDTINMNQADIDIEIWDNNKEDGDVVSLSLNGEFLCQNLEVTNKKVNFRAKNLSGKNLLILYAENLGSIPPNTAAIKVTSGETTKEIVLNSDKGKSEAIQILVE